MRGGRRIYSRIQRRIDFFTHLEWNNVDITKVPEWVVYFPQAWLLRNWVIAGRFSRNPPPKKAVTVLSLLTGFWFGPPSVLPPVTATWYSRSMAQAWLKWKSRNIAYSIFRSNRISRVLNTQNFHFRQQQVMLTYSIVKILLDLKSDSLSSLIPGMSILLSLQREWLYPVVGCGAFKGILQKLCRPRVSSSPHEIYAPWPRPAGVVLSYCWGFPSCLCLFYWSAGDSLS